MKQGSRLSETIQLFYKDGAVHANRQDVGMIDIVNSTFHSIKRLFLSQNKIKHLHGMGQFKDLRILSLSYNYIEDFKELKYIPASVESLSLEGNPIANHPNYRLNVIEQIPQLKILDTKPVKDLERRDIIDANQLADYLPKLLFALDKLCTKTYKDILILGAQVEQYRKFGNTPNNVDNEFEFSFPSHIPKNGEYKRCVRRIPPLSDVKDTRITVDGVRNLARNMFEETLVSSTLEECNNIVELDRFRLELKEKIVKQYKEVKKYANAVACLEKEQRFAVYSGDQTQLYIFIKCMVQMANQLFERENERERLMTYLKYCESNTPKPIPRDVNKQQTLNIQTIPDKPKVENSEKDRQVFTSPPTQAVLDETPRYQRNDSSNGSIEDDDTVVISEDQLTSPERDRTTTISVITAPDSVLEENAFFLTKSTALHYKKWNKLFSKAKASLSMLECGDEQEAERRADEYRNQRLKSKVLESLKYYKEKRQEYRAQYEKKRKLKNIKARSFYVKSLQCKGFSALIQNMQRRQNFKRAIRILRKVRYELILKKFFDSWRSLLLRCSDIRPLTAPPKREMYDSEKEKPREDSSKSKYNRRKDRPQSAGNALLKHKEKENEAEQNGYNQRHRYKEGKERIEVEVDGPTFVKKDKRKRKTVVMLSVASNF